MKQTINSIAVFCGASTGTNPIYKEAAKALGYYFPTHQITLVYGGGKIGLMGIIADAVMANKGKVIGVIPELLRHEEVIHTAITEMIITQTMAERKIAISKRVDGYIILAGGFGTLDELFEALTLGQLTIENKPVGILNTNGFYNHTLKQLDRMVADGFLKQRNRDMLLIAETIPELITKMENYTAPPIGKVINTVATR